MTVIAVYLFAVSALSGYRTSKYWPGHGGSFRWIGSSWWGWGGALAGTVAMVVAQGWMTGLLVSFCAYTALLSCVIFFAACGRRTWRGAVIAFHVLCAVYLLIMYCHAS